MRLGPEGGSSKPKKATPLSRPAPALRDKGAPPKPKRANPKKRRLTERQQRLQDRYGVEYKQRTGEDLASNLGLTRALLEQGIAPASDLRDVMNTDTGPVPLRLSGPDRLRGATNDVQRAGPWPNEADPVLPIRRAYGAGLKVKLPSLDKTPEPDVLLGQVMNEIERRYGAGAFTQQTIGEIASRNPSWSDYLDAVSPGLPRGPAGGAWTGETVGSNVDDLTNAILLGSGAGEIAGTARLGIGLGKAALGMGAKTIAEKGAAEGTKLLARQAVTGGTRAAPRVALGAGKAVIRPGKTFGKVVKRTGLAPASMLTVHAGNAAAAQLSGLEKPPLPFDQMDDYGISAEAYAAGGHLDPQRVQEIERTIGKDGHVIPTEAARKVIFERAKKNGWNPDENTSDIQLIQQSMLRSPSGARQFAGNALHGVAQLADVPGFFRAAADAGVESVRQGSATPAADLVQHGFIDPTLYQFAHPVAAFKANPYLALTTWHGGLRTGGAALGRHFPKGERRFVQLPGQSGFTDIGPKSRNLVDRPIHTLHDAFVSRGSSAADAGRLARAGHRRGVQLQTRMGTDLIGRTYHVADVKKAQLTHKFERAQQSLTPDQAAAWNLVLKDAPLHERPDASSFLADFDSKIAQMTHHLHETERKLAERDEKTGDLKIPEGSEIRSQMELDVAQHIPARIELLRNLRESWKDKPASSRKLSAIAQAQHDLNQSTIGMMMERGLGDERALQQRLHADVTLLDPEIIKAEKDAKKAAATQHRAELRVREKNTEQARAQLEAAKQEHAQAQRELEAAKARAQARVEAPTPAAPEPQAALRDTDAMLRDKGILADSGQLRGLMTLYRRELPRSRNRSAANQQTVDRANSFVGREILTPDGEHGIVTGVVRGPARGRRGGELTFEYQSIGKDGSIYPGEMKLGDVSRAADRFEKATGGVVMQRGAADRAGWTRAEEHPTVYLLGDHPLRAGEESTSGRVQWLKDTPDLGVGKLVNNTGLGRAIPRSGGYAEHYAAVVRSGDMTYALPGAHFATGNEARAHVREIQQRVQQGEDISTANAAVMRAREEAVANAPEPFANTPAPEPVAPEAPPEPVPARFTPKRLADARRTASSLRTQAKRLRDAAARQQQTAAPAEVKMSRKLRDAIVEELRAKQKGGGADQLASILEEQQGSSLNIAVKLDADQLVALRRAVAAVAERKTMPAPKVAADAGIRTAAKNLLEKLPRNAAARKRSAAAAPRNERRAADLERRADVLEKRVTELEAATKAHEVAQAKQRAGELNATAVAAAEKRAAATKERVAAAEKAAAEADARPKPERPDYEGIGRDVRQGYVENMRARGAVGGMRPHTPLEETYRSAHPHGPDYVARTDVRDVLGRGRFERNTGQIVRAGRDNPDTALMLRSAEALPRAFEIVDGTGAFLDKFGDRVEVPEGAKLGPKAQLARRRKLEESYAKLADGKDPDASASARDLADGTFEILERTEEGRRVVRDLGIDITADQVIVRSADGVYYVMPREMMENVRRWFIDTMEAVGKEPSALAKATKMWRTQALNTRLTTPVNNLLGNIMLAVTGGAGPTSFVRAAKVAAGKETKWSGVIDPVARGAGNAATATGAARPGEGLILGGRDPIRTGTRKYVNAIRHANIVAEDYGRFALWLDRAVKDAKTQQYGALRSKFRRANDETVRMIRDGEVDFEKINRHVEDFFGNLYKRGKYDRTMFLAIPFHRWFKHMLNLTLVTMPTKYPRRAALLSMMGGVGEDYREKHGVYPPWMRGVILTTLEHTPIGNVVQHSIPTTGFNPFATPIQFLGGGLAAGQNPLLTSALRVLTLRHAEDWANPETLLGVDDPDARHLVNAEGKDVQVLTGDWARSVGNEVAGWVPLINLVGPQGGRSDTYLPLIDDTLPVIGRLGSDQARKYKNPYGTAFLPADYAPPHADRGWKQMILNYGGVRDAPIAVGGPAFWTSYRKAFGQFQKTASRQRP